MSSPRKRVIKTEPRFSNSPKRLKLDQVNMGAKYNVAKKVKPDPGSQSTKKTTKVKTEAEKATKPKANKKSAKTGPSVIKKQLDTSESFVSTSGVSWEIPEVIASNLSVPTWACRNVVQLLEEGCTFPFIARYRKEKTGNMDLKKLKEACSLVEDLKAVENKVKSIKVKIEEQGKLSKELDAALSNAQSLTEVECLYAPYKPGVKGSLAERARSLGLEPLALNILDGNYSSFQLAKYINTEEPGLETEEKILEGVLNIVADIIHKHPLVMETIREMPKSGDIYIVSTKTKENKTKQKPGVKVEPEHKFSLYFDYRCNVRSINPHQVMAINRGESQGVLSVKVEVAGRVKERVQDVCFKVFKHALTSNICQELFVQCFTDAYNRLIQPQIIRLVRSNLTKTAEWASIEVFASNLKHLLLTAPFKGNTILAIDPGFKNGCKSAVISPTGLVLDTAVLYFCGSKPNNEQFNTLKKLIINNRPAVIAIGNGQACRETEEIVSSVIQSDFPHLNYCIVSESGASVYSVSDIAQQELPDLDHSLRGAVSIGRRLLDPLSEYVKVDPKHLSIGQYQHDLPKTQLKAALDSMIQECVSFVGVDINTCSECLLKHVAGLSANLAKKIIDHRNTSGPFVCRNSLRQIKGLGEKTFEQAAGFIRVHQANSGPGPQARPDEERNPAGKKKRTSKKKDDLDLNPTPLDMTCIHPESYNLTHRLARKLDVDLSDLGSSGFIEAVKQELLKHSVKSLSVEMDSGEETIQLILDALTKPLTYDFREDFEKPLFRSKIKSIDELKAGIIMTGKVNNVTSFGAFVDIGVGCNGLIHVSCMTLPGTKQRYPIKLGEKVEVKITNLDVVKQRISLQLMKVF